MKRCPVCKDFALYDDLQQTCPVCGAKLKEYRPGEKNMVVPSKTVPQEENPVRVVRPARPAAVPEQPAQPETRGTAAVQPARPARGTRPEAAPASTVPAFETRKGLHYVYRGTVLEVSYQARLHSTFKKCVNAVFHSEPYQFGHTAHLTVLRIKGPAPGRASGERRDVVFYGDVEGRFVRGDRVTVTTRRKGDRNIVTRLYSNETQSLVRPSPQIPSDAVKLLFALLSVLTIVMGMTIVGFVASGAFLQLISTLIQYAVAIFVVYRILRALTG